MTIDPRHTEWIEARGISADLAQKFGLETVSDNGANWLRVPYVRQGATINHKWRLTSTKKFKMDAGAPLALWNGDCLLEPSDEPVVITEGEWDAMTALQLGWRAVSVPNGAPAEASDDPANQKRYEYLWDARALLANVKRFIIATDGDKPGLALRADLIALLGPVRCSFVEYPEGSKDLNDVLLAHGPEKVLWLLKNAKPVPVRGLYKLSDFPEMPDMPMLDTGIPGLEDKFGLVAGTFSVITGYAGHGKSSLTLKMIANLLAGGVPVTIASFETLARPILERRLLAAMDERAEHNPIIWQNYQARRILEDRLSIISNAVDDETELDLPNLIDLMEAAVARHGSKLIILDPYNEVEHKRQRDESQTEYAGRFIRTIKRFCHRTGVAVWLVAHPRKPHTDGVPKPPSLYDISDSANFANKADYGLVIHRPDIGATEIDVSVTKVRMGLPGAPCRVTLTFDAARSRYNALVVE